MTLPRRAARQPFRRRILITGASSGLGAQLARIWAARGHDLVLCARRLPQLEKLRDELLTAHPQATVLTYELDVCDPEQAGHVFRAAGDRLGGLDRVVAGAGIGLGARIGDGDAEANRGVIETNVIGTLNTAEEAVGLFRDQTRGGHLVLISSVAGLRGMGGRMAAYSASKSAVATLAEAVRTTVWKLPVEVSAILPGYIDTALNADDPNKVWSVDLETGATALAAAIDAEPKKAYVPRRPWAYLAPIMRIAPPGLWRRMTG